jgi:hypothetical protein
VEHDDKSATPAPKRERHGLARKIDPTSGRQLVDRERRTKTTRQQGDVVACSAVQWLDEAGRSRWPRDVIQREAWQNNL